MNTSQPWSAETHQTTVDLMVAFLENRLEEKETIEWALDPGSIAEQKRRAILRLLNPPWEFSPQRTLAFRLAAYPGKLAR